MTEITPDLLLRAYSIGIFPMAESRDDPRLFWVDPRQRGVMPPDSFHLSRSLKRRMKKGGYHVAINHDFEATVAACADRPETWINQDLFLLYAGLHDLGHAHSFEIRGPDGAFWGGVFGVTLGAAFFGESMFSRRTDGSKIALAHLCDHLVRSGYTLFDTQFITAHLASLGALEIPRAEYHDRLRDALRHGRDFAALPPAQDPYGVIQRITQTS